MRFFFKPHVVNHLFYGNLNATSFEWTINQPGILNASLAVGKDEFGMPAALPELPQNLQGFMRHWH